MSRVIISLLFLSCVSFSMAMAQDDAKKLSEILAPGHQSEGIDLEKIVPGLRDQMSGKNQVTLKSHSGWKIKSEKTTNISRGITNGVTCHVALYPDVCIVTALDGPKVDCK